MFAIAAVHFESSQEAERFNQAIDDLRKELKLSPHKEFHFSNDKPTLKIAFLQCAAQFDFVYGAFVLDKTLLTDPSFKQQNYLYKFAVQKAFESLEGLWNNTTIVFDRCGGHEFTKVLKNHIRLLSREWSSGDGRVRIKDVKSAQAHKSNLLQLADMTCGAVFRSYSSKNDALEFRDIIRNKEHCVQIWPDKQENPPPYPESSGTRTIR